MKSLKSEGSESIFGPELGQAAEPNAPPLKILLLLQPHGFCFGTPDHSLIFEAFDEGQQKLSGGS